MSNRVADWPLLRQLRDGDSTGRGAAVKSKASRELRPRTADADRVVKSVCPYCAVGCGQDVYVKDGKVVQIEGDADSPGGRPDREPGAVVPQLDGGRARHVVRPRRRHDVPRRPTALRLHRHPGLQHGRSPSGRLPVGHGGQGPGRDGHPRRSALQPHQRPGRRLRSHARRHRHRLPRRHHQLRPDRGQGVPRVRRGLHQRVPDHQRGLPGHRGPRRALLRLGPRPRRLRLLQLAVRGRHRPGGLGRA
jgi:hypothetical protein